MPCCLLHRSCYYALISRSVGPYFSCILSIIATLTHEKLNEVAELFWSNIWTIKASYDFLGVGHASLSTKCAHARTWPFKHLTAGSRRWEGQKNIYRYEHSRNLFRIKLQLFHQNPSFNLFWAVFSFWFFVAICYSAIIPFIISGWVYKWNHWFEWMMKENH